MAPVKLPSYVIFVGDNGYNLGHKVLLENYHFLQFNTNERNKTVSHEVIPVPDSEDKDVVMIKSLDNGMYWRWIPRWDWIWADRCLTPEAGDKEYLFKVVQVNDETAALQCLGNSRYLQRRSGQRQEDVDCLAASASDYKLDVTTHLRVTSALFNRRVFDVEYDMKKMTEPSKSPPISLGSKTETNNSSRTKDIEVVVPCNVESKYSWRTVTTFNTGLPLTVTAGIPDFTTKSSSNVLRREVENGKMYTAETLETITHTVKGVAPGETVEVEITGSQARARVPFKYQFVDSLTEEKDLAEKSGEFGVFEGVQVLDIKAVESRRPGDAPVKLPKYVVFVGDNKLNLGLHSDEDGYLSFASRGPSPWTGAEVIRATDYHNVVRLKNLRESSYWRREATSNWIRVIKDDPEEDDKDCLFKVFQVTDNTAVLQCLANSLYLKRFTHDGKVSCLNAGASAYDDANDHTTRLQVTWGLQVRVVYNVEYDMKKMTEPLELPETLNTGRGTNHEDDARDITVVVKYTVKNKYSWRTVADTTFKPDMNLTVTAGIPNFATKETDEAVRRRVLNGVMEKSDTSSLTMSHTFRKVKPGKTVELQIKGSRTIAKVPFTYKFADHRVDGVDMKEATGEDGVFEGEQVLDIKKVYEGSGETGGV